MKPHQPLAPWAYVGYRRCAATVGLRGRYRYNQLHTARRTVCQNRAGDYPPHNSGRYFRTAVGGVNKRYAAVQRVGNGYAGGVGVANVGVGNGVSVFSSSTLPTIFHLSSVPIIEKLRSKVSTVSISFMVIQNASDSMNELEVITINNN